MNELINSVLMPIINDGLISVERISELIYIKDFVDRISTTSFASIDECKELEKRFGVKPDIQSWGDYFQTKMASQFLYIPDDEFSKVVDTLKFDMISSWIIFENKDQDFLDWVDQEYILITGMSESGMSEDEKEIFHLKILKDYFVNCGIQDNFSESEKAWYEPFKEAMAI